MKRRISECNTISFACMSPNLTSEEYKPHSSDEDFQEMLVSCMQIDMSPYWRNTTDHYVKVGRSGS